MSKGVWAVIHTDVSSSIERCYPEDQELEARRSVGTQGYWQEVLFIPWGMDVLEARRIETSRPKYIHDSREPECVANWPECFNGDYSPRCCRWPKSCSVRTIEPGENDEPRTDSPE